MAGSSGGKAEQEDVKTGLMDNNEHAKDTAKPEQVAVEVRPGSPGSATSVVVDEPQYFEQPVETQCPGCGEQVTTVTIYKPGKLTWMSFGIVCLLGCWLGCCIIPFLLRGAKDVIHMCPKCNKAIARLRRI